MRLSTSPRRVAEPGTAAAEKPYFPLIRWDIHQPAAEKQRGSASCQRVPHIAREPGIILAPLPRCRAWLRPGAYRMHR